MITGIVYERCTLAVTVTCSYCENTLTVTEEYERGSHIVSPVLPEWRCLSGKWICPEHRITVSLHLG